MPPVDTAAKVLQYLGLAARARELVIGVPLICTALSRTGKGKTPPLVLKATDCSPNTCKRLSDRTAFYGATLMTLPVTCAELARAIGKKDALVAAVGVTEPHLCTAIRAALEQTTTH
ncbi:MAG: hypothetical protein E7624_07385 [Ruminococcaceae bacterium]|nr:hypothetical protein [Oscillospiraceae bacterium]